MSVFTQAPAVRAGPAPAVQLRCNTRARPVLRMRAQKGRVGCARVVRLAVAAAGKYDGLGQVVTVLGSQWGDEGKGKLVDILAQQTEVIVRAQVGSPHDSVSCVAQPGNPLVVTDPDGVLPFACMSERQPAVPASPSPSNRMMIPRVEVPRGTRFADGPSVRHVWSAIYTPSQVPHAPCGGACGF